MAVVVVIVNGIGDFNKDFLSNPGRMFFPSTLSLGQFAEVVVHIIILFQSENNGGAYIHHPPLI